MSLGRVKWFNEQKGYGFIEQEGGKDIFVHYTGIVGDGFKTLHENDQVEFDIQEDAKGLKAVGVKKIE
ncbi:MAG TPA: cold-shock protein [bacterium]|nr:cold-shock protein [bacterium]